MAARRRCKRPNFKVPTGIQSRNCPAEQSFVHFKNLSDDVIDIYWIDYAGKPQFFAELKPINRKDVGLQFITYVSHPFVAIYKQKVQCLLNGKRYFLPPVLRKWINKPDGWLSSKWNLQCNDIKANTTAEACEPRSVVKSGKYFEVLIVPTFCLSLKTFCLLKTCELYPDKESNKSLDIPADLKSEIELTRKKYYYYS